MLAEANRPSNGGLLSIEVGYSGLYGGRVGGWLAGRVGGWAGVCGLPGVVAGAGRWREKVMAQGLRMGRWQLLISKLPHEKFCYG